MPPAASEAEESDEEEAMEADSSQVDNDEETPKCNKRKKSQLVNTDLEKQVGHLACVFDSFFSQIAVIATRQPFCFLNDGYCMAH